MPMIIEDIPTLPAQVFDSNFFVLRSFRNEGMPSRYSKTSRRTIKETKMAHGWLDDFSVKQTCTVQKARFFFPQFEGASKRGEAESTATGGPKIYSLQWPHVVKDFERQQLYTWKFDAANVMFLAFTTLERDHNGDGLVSGAKAGDFAVDCWGVSWFDQRELPEFKPSFDLYGLCICKHPNRTKKELLPAFSCSLKCCGDLLTQQMIQMTVNMWWNDPS